MNVKLSEAQKNARISNPAAIAVIMQQILKRENKLGRSQEHFWVIGLGNSGKLLFIELIGLGRQNRVTANPPDVFRMAIYKLALKLILVHNHPGGELIPSAADKAFTDRIIKVGEIINIEVTDHLIISEKGYLSFEETGIMNQLKKADTWRIIEKDQLDIKQLQQQMDKKETVKNTKLGVARKLKAAGMNDAAIKKATGLALSLIREL